MLILRSCALVVLMIGSLGGVHVRGADPDVTKGMLGHWPLRNDARDASGNGLDARDHGVVWNPSSDQSREEAGGVFDGRQAYLEVAADKLDLDQHDFSFAAWVWADDSTDDVPGDLISQYDPATRRGFQVSIKTNTGVTFNQSNFRQLQFGIDENQMTVWRDCGKPGNQSLLAFGLIAHRGHLYAGTCEPGSGDAGRVSRYSHGTTWIDCGAPSAANAVTSMAAFGGELYVGTGKYRVAGSALAESENAHLGGEIFRYAGGNAWAHSGSLQLAGEANRIEAVSGLVTFQGRHYAGSLYKPAGFFVMSGPQSWSEVPVPNGKRVEALAVYNGNLYASSYDSGHVFQFDGTSWTDLGQLGANAENSQTYSFAIYEGRLYAGTWPSGRVYRFDGANRWTDVGRLGEELEVMGMMVHNGRLIAGTLPLAEVYQYNGGTEWQKIAQLDTTPDVKYRRAWTMAEFQGQLFCSTLPNGQIHSCEVGKQATWDDEFPSGWHHVTAVKSGGRLKLIVDGVEKAASSDFDPVQFDLSNRQPLRIGAGPNDFFRGRMRDVRLYDRALSPEEAQTLAANQPN